MQKRIGIAALAAATVMAGALPAGAAQLKLLLPQGRTSFQDNELVDISAVRGDAAPLAAGTLTLTVTGADGGKLSFDFPVAGGATSSTENLHLNGWLLRPEKYTVDVASDGATAETTFTVYSHIRKSTYRTVHWGGPSGKAMIPEGENGVGFNLIFNGNVADQVQSIEAGEDIMGNCLMGGGHQHDLRVTNDWSDPNVYLGADQRGLDRAFVFRTMPNAIGAHLHDEPGLTWLPNPHYLDKDGKPIANDQDIPEQRAAFLRAYGHDPLWSDQVDVKDPAQYAKWSEQNDFKLGFMDAFWKSANEDLSRLKPGYLAVTQSQYGWSALYDGYYFNVARSLPVISGHGGYDNFGLRSFNPDLFLEMALPRQLDKPTWYLPMWGIVSSDQIRLEDNLCFMTGIQGMSFWPGPAVNMVGTQGLTETNQLYQKIGTIFTKPEYTPQDVTILYSKSNQYYNKKQGQRGLFPLFMATKLDQYPVSVVLEEDILDGSLAAGHKACLLTGIDHLDDNVIAGLADFIKDGGTVVETGDCTVDIPGAIRVGLITGQTKNDEEMKAAQEIADPKAKAAAMAKLTSFNTVLDIARPLAAQLKDALDKAGVQPTFRSSVPTIAAGKQVRGDIEYDFAVNFTPASDEVDTNGYGAPVPVTANITLPGEGPVYDAVTGTMLPFKKSRGGETASLQFAPGQMYAFARTARPIGGVQVGTPTINRDFTRLTDPLRVDITATLMDNQNRLLAGNAPMQVKVTDPAGNVRYNVYRAAEKGVLQVSLPLAANDPAGQWTVAVTELLSNTGGTSAFAYRPAAQCGVVAGETPRAVILDDDKDNVYRFFRDHRNVYIVPGTSPYDAAAAQRLVDIFKPYNVNCTIVPLAIANTARPITDEEALTWCGNAASGTLNANQRQDPRIVGYNLSGPTVLIGNAADNPMIAFLQTSKVLPYTPTADFPGAGHGMVAWNLLTLGHDVESIALIGNDEAGINQAVGTAFQLGEGIDYLNPLNFPVASNVTLAPRMAAAQ